jgi:hypothetical protein
MKNHKVFSVTLTVAIHDDNNVLSSYEDAHEDDVSDLITDVFFDIDDVKIKNITVKERV